MQRRLLKSKIHRARVTDADLHYVGSLTVDPVLLEAADIYPQEQVHVVTINNGARFETYVVTGERNSGEMKINGAAARLAHPDDLIIVFSYADYSADEIEGFCSRVVHVDERNRITAVNGRVDELVRASDSLSL